MPITLALLAAVIDLLAVRPVALLYTLIDLSVLSVILVTIFRGLALGGVSAVLAASLQGLVSVYPWPLHLAVFALTSLTAWVFMRLIVTSRSTISFLSSVAAGTMMANLSLAIGLVLTFRLGFIGVAPDWRVWILPAVVHLITQPLVSVLVWRASGGGHFERLTPSLERSF